MESKSPQKNNRNIISIISLMIPITLFLLILNWFFRITPYQRLQGIPILIAPCAGIVGIVLGFISSRKSHNNLTKFSIVINSILVVLPFFYWFLGTLVFGI
jgi:hypothetical protein